MCVCTCVWADTVFYIFPFLQPYPSPISISYFFSCTYSEHHTSQACHNRSPPLIHFFVSSHINSCSYCHETLFPISFVPRCLQVYQVALWYPLGGEERVPPAEIVLAFDIGTVPPPPSLRIGGYNSIVRWAEVYRGKERSDGVKEYSVAC